MIPSRRQFIQVGGIGLLTFSVAGCEKKLTPAEARKESVPFRTLNASEVTGLESLGEILLPGSAAAGLAHYLDHQLSGPEADSMLMIKYLMNPPYLDFYRTGLAAFNAHTRLRSAGAVVADIAAGTIANWAGPPAGLFYFVLRSDAVDVVYGTEKGFENLGVPYMPHIPPPSRWGE